jgi:hypothetical protein
MGFAAILAGLIKIFGAVAQYLGNKQLIDAGEAKVIAEGATNVIDNLARVKAAREALGPDLDSDRAKRVHDEFRRPD